MHLKLVQVYWIFSMMGSSMVGASMLDASNLSGCQHARLCGSMMDSGGEHAKRKHDEFK